MSSKRLIVGEIHLDKLQRAIELYDQYDQADRYNDEIRDQTWTDYYNTCCEVCYNGHALVSLIYEASPRFRTVENFEGVIKLLGLHTHEEVDYGDEE